MDYIKLRFSRARCLQAKFKTCYMASSERELIDFRTGIRLEQRKLNSRQLTEDCYHSESFFFFNCSRQREHYEMSVCTLEKSFVTKKCTFPYVNKQLSSLF